FECLEIYPRYISSAALHPILYSAIGYLYPRAKKSLLKAIQNDQDCKIQRRTRLFADHRPALPRYTYITADRLANLAFGYKKLLVALKYQIRGSLLAEQPHAFYSAIRYPQLVLSADVY